jgi:hypothetical protein
MRSAEPSNEGEFLDDQHCSGDRDDRRDYLGCWFENDPPTASTPAIASTQTPVVLAAATQTTEERWKESQAR